MIKNGEKMRDKKNIKEEKLLVKVDNRMFI